MSFTPIEIHSRCGNRCDLCLIYRPNVEKEDRRAKVCAAWDKLGLSKYPPAETICDGCLSDKEDAVLLSSGACKARPCVIGRGLPHCGHCPDYPCDIFPAEPNAGDFYAGMKRKDIDWTPEDDEIMEPYNPKKFIDEWRKNRA